MFYGYDESCYLTECNFRRIPPAPYPEYEMSGEPWFSVGPADVFPEEFATFLLPDPSVRQAFFKSHRDLLAADYWQQRQERVNAGILEDIFPYQEAKRFPRQPEVPAKRPYTEPEIPAAACG